MNEVSQTNESCRIDVSIPKERTQSIILEMIYKEEIKSGEYWDSNGRIDISKVPEDELERKCVNVKFMFAHIHVSDNVKYYLMPLIDEYKLI